LAMRQSPCFADDTSHAPPFFVGAVEMSVGFRMTPTSPADGTEGPVTPRTEIMAVTARAPEPLLVTVNEAADILSLCRTTIYELVDRGELRPVHVGRALRFPVAELARFVEALMSQGPAS
jgi:excisionase family DNA binding protein